VSRINDGEPVVTSSVHLAEVANVLEDWRTQEDARAIEGGLLSRETIAILTVGRSNMVEALDLAGQAHAGLTDALAVILMRRNDLGEVYSFDHDFDRFADVKRIAS
jgi:predicted nucleic acid-binding protein